MTQTRPHRPLVVVGVDGSAEAQAAAGWAAEYVKGTGGSLELVTAWHWPVAYGYPMSATGYDPESSAHTIADEAAKKVDLPQQTLQITVVAGVPAQVLVAASARADLLVVGSRGLGGFSGLLMGSVGAHCVHHAACPVLVYRPPTSS